MGAITSSPAERAEMEAVLQSGLFDKAPRLGKFFCYICDRYFDGKADQIKEYSIAVEALGRSAEFDSKRDSIVRVEAHRLRKRLEEYYRGLGTDHAIQILIPNGQYRPHFVVRDLDKVQADARPAATLSERDLLPLEIEPPAPQHSPLRKPFRRLLIFALPIVVLVAVLVALPFRHKVAAPAATSQPEEVWNGTATDPVPAEFRMLAGYHGTPYVDRQGHTWVADAFYSGGACLPISSDHFIEGLPDPHLLKSQRSGRFRYDIPLSHGTHELRLYFAETEYGPGNTLGGGEGTRTFNVFLNGKVLRANLDPLAGAGAPNRLHEVVLKDVTAGPDGKLHLRFDPLGLPATLNAIEVLSASPGRVQPIRIVTQNAPITDSDGRIWAADEYFSGGTLVFRRNVSLDRPERPLFQGERYGNFSYRIPVAPGKYNVTLHFVETWFGTPESNFAPLDSREFDVYANGIALLRNFHLGKDAGGPNRIVEKVFRGLQPNAQGVLLLDFVPERNYAEVNAIEVVQAE